MMKKFKIILLLSFVFLSITSYSQVKKDTLKSKTATNSFNLMDAQLGAIKDMVGDEKIDGIDFSKITNYNDLVDKLELSSKEKAHYKSVYEMQKNELDQKSKDSLALVLENLILNAKKKKNG